MTTSDESASAVAGRATRRWHAREWLALVALCAATWWLAFGTGPEGTWTAGNAGPTWPDAFTARGARSSWWPLVGWIVVLRPVLGFLAVASLLTAPGLFLAAALRAQRDLASWILEASALTVVILALVGTVAQACASQPLTGNAFAALVALTALACAAPAFVLARRGRLQLPAWRGLLGDVALVVGALSVIVCALQAKVWQEDFNGDGVHAFESARLLLQQPLPFFGREYEELSGFPDLKSMVFAYPTSWFIRLLGPHEASARLPFFLHLLAVWAGVVAFAQHGARRMLTAGEKATVWLALAIFTVVMAYSATYNPYTADLAMPAAQDTQVVATFLGFTVACLRGDKLIAILFLVLTHFGLPNGILQDALWIAGFAVLVKPRDRGMLLTAIAAFAACVVFDKVASMLMARAGVLAPGGEYDAGNLFKRFRYLDVVDVRRFLWLAVPCGILPALALVAWRRLDGAARAMSLVVLGTFAVFYVQAFVVLHHFVPVMTLPLAVWWRMRAQAPADARLTAAAAALAAAGLWISLPPHAGPVTVAHDIGRRIDDRRGDGYEAMDARAFKSARLLARLFPIEWEPAVPEQAYGGSPNVWQFYAWHAARYGPRVEPNYVLLAQGAPPPEGFTEIARGDGAVLMVREQSLLEQHRALRPPTPAGAALYAIPRDILFRRKRGPAGLSFIDVAEVLRTLGLRK